MTLNFFKWPCPVPCDFFEWHWTFFESNIKLLMIYISFISFSNWWPWPILSDLDLFGDLYLFWGTLNFFEWHWTFFESNIKLLMIYISFISFSNWWPWPILSDLDLFGDLYLFWGTLNFFVWPWTFFESNIKLT